MRFLARDASRLEGKNVNGFRDSWKGRRSPNLRHTGTDASERSETGLSPFPRELDRLRRTYGKGKWRKRKGTARVKLRDGTIRLAEVPLYEESGIGKKEYKIKRYLD